MFADPLNRLYPSFCLYLVFRRYRFQSLLDHTTSVHLQRQRQHMSTDALSQSLLLLSRTELKELLNDVIAKDVRHQTVRCTQDLVEHHLSLSWGGTLKLLLDKPGAVLVLCLEQGMNKC